MHLYLRRGTRLAAGTAAALLAAGTGTALADTAPAPDLTVTVGLAGAELGLDVLPDTTADTPVVLAVEPDTATHTAGGPEHEVWVAAPTTGGSATAIDLTGLPDTDLAPATPITVELTEVTGPGTATVDLVDAVAEGDGADTEAPEPVAVPPGEVVDARWTFTEPGDYAVTLAATAELATGATVTAADTVQLLVEPLAAPAAPRRPATAPAAPTQPPATPQSAPRQTPDPSGDRPGTNGADASPRTTATATDPAVGGDTVVLDDGHIDVAARIVDGDMEISVKDDTAGGGPVWRRLDSVVVHITQEAATDTPSGSEYDFLGADGGTVWMIPQVQRSGVVWAGWNTEEISAGELNGQVTWTLRDADGPGRFTLFSTSSFGGADVLFNGARTPDSFDIPTGTHAHGNWTFTAEGAYYLDFEMSATLSGAGAVSDSGTLAVAVGDTDPDTLDPGGSGGGGNGGGGDGGENRSGGNESNGARDGGGGGNSGNGTGGNGSGALPRTGPVLLPLAGSAVLCVVVGLALMYAARLRGPEVVA